MEVIIIDRQLGGEVGKKKMENTIPNLRRKFRARQIIFLFKE